MKAMKVILIATMLVASNFCSSQQWITRNGTVEFFSATIVENIEATNEMASGLLANDGRFAFRVPILGFRFEKALMEEHFNENYLESTRFPNGTFEGAIANWSDAFQDGQSHTVKAQGILTIHGIAIEREIESTLQWDGTAWIVQSEFTVLTAAHEIPIPKMVREKIAEEISVDVQMTLSPR